MKKRILLAFLFGFGAQAAERARLAKDSWLYKVPAESRGPVETLAAPLKAGESVVVERRSSRLPWAYVRREKAAGWIPLASLGSFEPIVVTRPRPARVFAPAPPTESEALLKSLREERAR